MFVQLAPLPIQPNPTPQLEKYSIKARDSDLFLFTKQNTRVISERETET